MDLGRETDRAGQGRRLNHHWLKKRKAQEKTEVRGRSSLFSPFALVRLASSFSYKGRSDDFQNRNGHRDVGSLVSCAGGTRPAQGTRRRESAAAVRWPTGP